jgi:hypothetical protein
MPVSSNAAASLSSKPVSTPFYCGVCRLCAVIVIAAGNGQ